MGGSHSSLNRQKVLQPRSYLHKCLLVSKTNMLGAAWTSAKTCPRHVGLAMIKEAQPHLLLPRAYASVPTLKTVPTTCQLRRAFPVSLATVPSTVRLNMGAVPMRQLCQAHSV